MESVVEYNAGYSVSLPQSDRQATMLTFMYLIANVDRYLDTGIILLLVHQHLYIT